MAILDATILGVVQGLTEFLPISSSGHLILAREFFGLDVAGGLAFDAVLHFATALAVAAYFWKDLWRLFVSLVQWILRREVSDEYKQLLVAIVVATIPAVIAGLLLEDIMATVFRNSLVVVIALLVGTQIMAYAEKRVRNGLKVPRTVLGIGADEDGDGFGRFGWKKAVVVGLFQSLALVPGMSRSGMAISGGMIMGLSREMSARFAFLLAVPLLLGAGTKKALELAQSGVLVSDAAALAAGAASAFIVGILVVHYLLRFLRTHTLKVFIWYRYALVLLVLLFVFM